MRGLKLINRKNIVALCVVASFTDAWIETVVYGSGINKKMSHPSRMRGLKQTGRKTRNAVSGVASFTDAWIETLKQLFRNFRERVASFTDAWIETKSAPVRFAPSKCRILHGCVD